VKSNEMKRASFLKDAGIAGLSSWKFPERETPNKGAASGRGSKQVPTGRLQGEALSEGGSIAHAGRCGKEARDEGGIKGMRDEG
jgi:hypothetical protein